MARSGLGVCRDVDDFGVAIAPNGWRDGSNTHIFFFWQHPDHFAKYFYRHLFCLGEKVLQKTAETLCRFHQLLGWHDQFFLPQYLRIRCKKLIMPTQKLMEATK